MFIKYYSKMDISIVNVLEGLGMTMDTLSAEYYSVIFHIFTFVKNICTRTRALVDNNFSALSHHTLWEPTHTHTHCARLNYENTIKISQLK